MPIFRRKDNIGSFYQYGDTGKKYYYITNNKRSRLIAKRKAIKQMRAIHVRK